MTNKKAIVAARRSPNAIKKREINLFLRQSGIDIEILNEVILRAYKSSIKKRFGVTTYDPVDVVNAVRDTLFNMLTEAQDSQAEVELWDLYLQGEIELDVIDDDESVEDDEVEAAANRAKLEKFLAKPSVLDS